MKRLVRFFTFVVLVGLTSCTGRADSGFAFHAIGDLAGGPTLSLVRDATRVGGTIYAVGGSAALNQVLCVSPNNPVGCVGAIGPDTAMLWTWDGTSEQMTALPNLVTNAPGNISIAAAAITPDAAYIASQARTAVAGVRLAVRVDRSLLPAVAANTNLNAAPYIAYSQPTAAQGISANGNVLVGPVSPSVRVARFDVTNAAGNVLVPLLRPGDTNNSPVIRGISANGSVIIGTSFANPYSGKVGGQAFRYNFNNVTNTGSLFALPFLPGGTWNRAAAISPNGALTLVTGNGFGYANGELAIHNAATDTYTTLGSPNTPWTPSGLAGMTGDGSVVVATFNASNGYHDGYFHNQNGWFHLESAFASNGVDIKAQGWRQFFVAGISADGTLVYGQGIHNGNTEGFVAEFPAGYLATYDVPAVAPSDTSIVGTWLLQEPGQPADGAVAFMADGTYFHVETGNIDIAGAPGFERGRYMWNPATGALRMTTLVDTNGDIGASSVDGQLGVTATVLGDALTILDPLDNTPDGTITLTRLQRVEGTPIGGWIGGDANAQDHSRLFIGLPDGTYIMAVDSDPAEDTGGIDGIEAGVLSYNFATGELSGTTPLDTNGVLGFSHPDGPVFIHIAIDDLTASGTDDMGEPIFIRRIIDPNSVRPSFLNAGTVSGTLGAPFSFATSASFHAFSFTAAGLPAGLTIDGATGVISGTPAALGAFTIDLTASNSLATGSGVLVITINPITCPAGSHLEAPTDLVCTPDPPVITRSGFYSPVKAGVNDQKGGSTVPLKFNVTVNGVEKTDTAGLALSLTKVNCSTGATLGSAPFNLTGGSSFSYDGSQFHANWKTPSDAGACYVVKMTTTADRGSIGATFKIK